MAAPSDITLPSELLPGDGRFGSGPSKVDVAALEALAATGATYMGTSHRQSGVRSVVGAIRSGLKDLYDLPDGYEVVLGVGGATAFWDAAAFGLIQRRSQHLVFGEFSGKFAAVAKGAPHLETPDIAESAPGTYPHDVPASTADVVAQTHNETSTGVMMPLGRPQGSTAVIAVDATSAAGAVRVDPRAFDVYYFSPQKAFGSEGGLWVALCSPAAIDRIELVAASGRWIPPFLNLKLAVANSRKDQTYNTPALATLFLLRHQIDAMNERGGLAKVERRVRRSSDAIYDWAEARPWAQPYVSAPEERSPTVATIDFADHIAADDLESVLRRQGILDVSGYRKLGRNQLRLACFPNVEPEDVTTLTAAIDYVVEAMAT
ncbi:MAG TPA: phosphoserine transaminase [Acidimicrobiia bacterium]|jgi:phosphoserine aminotransferase|nr:phosphoserine transaminase [Acidimicrobiia bacterium]